MKDKYGKTVQLRDVLVNKDGVEAMCVSINRLCNPPKATLRPCERFGKLTRKSYMGCDKEYKRLFNWEIIHHVTTQTK